MGVKLGLWHKEHRLRVSENKILLRLVSENREHRRQGAEENIWTEDG
jgi:hypothetical protein